MSRKDTGTPGELVGVRTRGHSSSSYVLRPFPPFWLNLNASVCREWKQEWYRAARPPFWELPVLCEGTSTLVHNSAAKISLADLFKPYQDSAIRLNDGWINLLKTFQSKDRLQVPVHTFPCWSRELLVPSGGCSIRLPGGLQSMAPAAPDPGPPLSQCPRAAWRP